MQNVRKTKRTLKYEGTYFVGIFVGVLVGCSVGVFVGFDVGNSDDVVVGFIVVSVVAHKAKIGQFRSFSSKKVTKVFQN